ncbi:conserved hypothetical protein [Coccidioides posadasii str. Silveira]|uniref:Uncharacterized protein n=1 Tax=Coccidioides posadasii (strain RMSCC 757 / Silveira) TaxID=443226 RepID=E9DCR0_COCPS|nr:conserved hypothetical protein [Coccidioides posadasii str. Silveira]
MCLTARLKFKKGVSVISDHITRYSQQLDVFLLPKNIIYKQTLHTLLSDILKNANCSPGPALRPPTTPTRAGGGTLSSYNIFKISLYRHCLRYN